MSAPKPLKAMSLRDTLAKTVRLLTKQGVDVQFRGHQPFVQTRGNKVQRLVLPEVNDNASPELIEALQGFLDHEVGHIFYTPFANAEKFAAGNRVRQSLCNIIEDIRLEKLLPRDLPGTKENLERMYDNVMDTFFGPPALEAKDPNMSKSEAFSRVLVVGMRALSGQKAFQVFMDTNDLWPHFMPLVKRMPNISRRLRDLETFNDVTRLTEDILEAMKPEKKDEDGKDGPKQPDPNADASIDPNAKNAKDDPQDSDDGDDGEDTEGSGGEGHGDGEGTDDGEDDEDSGSCKGGPGDDDGDADGEGTDDGEDEGGDRSGADSDDAGDDSGEGDQAGDQDGGDGDGDADDGNSDQRGETDSEASGKDGKENRSLRDALALLEPTQRRALFLYKKRQQTVAEIANDLNKTEDETVDLLAQARKRLRDLLNGG